MATNDNNGKARRQNFVSLTLQAAGEGDVKYAQSGKPWGKIRGFFSQGKNTERRIPPFHVVHRQGVQQDGPDRRGRGCLAEPRQGRQVHGEGQIGTGGVGRQRRRQTPVVCDQLRQHRAFRRSGSARRRRTPGRTGVASLRFTTIE